ncbi:unnamed protein product [Larinioides sclopetarius]|uniref:Uncharacterized protein n=1 Tax=Larinioides sclopetarius TaxID=280406 RepID=A0AAV2AZM4_9ARAC
MLGSICDSRLHLQRGYSAPRLPSTFSYPIPHLKFLECFGNADCWIKM